MAYISISTIKKTIIILFILGAIFFFIKDNREHKMAIHSFYCESYYGKIVNVTYDVKEYARVTNENNESFYLGNFISYNYFKIEIGDSIAKDDSSYVIRYFKKNGIAYEHYYDQYHPKTRRILNENNQNSK